jgi:hypothetical protein
MSCLHRKLATRVNSAGRFYIRCLDCKLDGGERDTVAEAFLHRREDLRDAEALRAAIAAKEGARV